MDKTMVKNIAFFDAEFTAHTAKDRGVQEMIQCALIIYSVELSADRKLIKMSSEPLFTYSVFVKPIYNPQLSEYIKGLTGITQESVDHGIKFEQAIEDIYSAIKQHNVKRIVIWGPDRILLKRNCDVLDCYNGQARSICGKFKDISQFMSDFFGYDTKISQHKACQLLHIQEDGELHDAYCDAMNLSRIIKEFYGQIRL